MARAQEVDQEVVVVLLVAEVYDSSRQAEERETENQARLLRHN